MSDPESRPRRDLSALRIPRTDDDQPGGEGGAGRGGRARWVLAAVAVVALAAVAGLAAWALRGSALLAPEVKLGTVMLERPSAGASTLLTATGHVAARRTASVSARRAGRLVALAVDQGDHVVEGQVLAEIDATDVQAMLESARSQVLEAEAREAAARARADAAATERERAVRMHEAGVGSRIDRDVAQASAREASAAVREAEAAVRSAQARVAEAVVQVEQSVVRAPFAGVVLRREAEVGESVAPAIASGQLTRGAIVTMADLATLEVEADVSEGRIALVDVGTPAEVALDAVPDRRYHGRVRTIAPTADRQKATVEVKVELVDPDERVRPEMEAKVTFLSAEPDAAALRQPPVLTVPASAIVPSGSEAIAFVVVEGVVSRRAVRVGETRGSRVVVLDGLEEGESVVLDPPSGLADGARVKLAG